MGDRTYHQAYISACPDDKAEVVLEVLHRHGFSYYGPADIDGDASLQLSESYHVEEAYLGTSLELAGELIQEAPEASFDVWEDPKYEWLGQGVKYAPELGRFDYNCDSTGNPVFTVGEVEKILAAPADHRDLLLGKAWD